MRRRQRIYRGSQDGYKGVVPRYYISKEVDMPKKIRVNEDMKR